MGDRQPTAAEAEYLASVFGWPPEGTHEPTGATETPDLAAAVVLLTLELKAMREEREAWTRGLVEVLRAYAEGRVPTDLLDALAPPPHVDAQP